MSLNKNVSHQEMAEIIREALVLKVTPLFEDLKGIEAAEVVRDYFLNNTIHPHAVFTFGQNIINRKQSDDTNFFAKELTETMAALVADNMILACYKNKNYSPFTKILELFCDEKVYKNSEKTSFILNFADGNLVIVCSIINLINKSHSEIGFIYTSQPSLEKVSKSQIEQIRLAGEAGLNGEQVKVIATSNLDAQQMFQVRLAYQLGLNMEQVKIIANPELDWLQISELHQSFKAGLDMEQVKDIIRLGFNGVQIHELNLAFQSKLPEEQFNSLIDSEFDQERMKELRLKFEAELSEGVSSHEHKM